MSVEEKARLAALEAENAQLKTAAAELAAREAASARAGRHDAHAAFCEGLVKAGKMLPVSLPFMVAFMDRVAEDSGVIEFGEGDAKKSVAGIEGFKAYLDAQPKVVEFREVTGGALQDDQSQDATAISAKAVEFQEAEAKVGRTINIAQAVAHIMARADK